MGGGGHLTRAFVSRYGDRDDVRRALFRNFESEGWRGPPSQHVQDKIEAVKRWLADTHNENVERWLSAYLNSLESRLEHELVQEEREG